jgi:Bacteriophage Sf6, terminase small subunit-like
MINFNREIQPEDFAVDPHRQFCGPDAEKQRDEARRQRAELERLYQIQEDAKAREAFKKEQARKEQIPYSETLAIEICGRISSGEFLINICKDEDMPTVRSVHQWLKDHSDFAALHKEAVNSRLNIFEDEVVTIADDSERDFKIVTKHGKQVKVLDSDVISRAKLRVEVRKAHLKAYRPERWSEQSTLNVNNTSDDASNLSLDELERKIAELEHKDRVVKKPDSRSAAS